MPTRRNSARQLEIANGYPKNQLFRGRSKAFQAEKNFSCALLSAFRPSNLMKLKESRQFK